jgi:TonB family protein
MPLRCLLFSSNEEMVQSIWQVLTDLGIEGEYCKSAVDAVERVTTQPFQIVITDWQDQPEAAFLLKTARDLKAAQRPLTLAIVSDDARPQALQAGANSVLLKPIRSEQVRDTLGTACELLRSKWQPGAPVPPRPAPEAAAMAAAASTAAVSASAPASVVQAPEKIRAGEFLQTPSSAPGGQFDTDADMHESMEVSAEPVEALTELEPMASAVESVETVPEKELAPQEALTGWAALQARLTKSAPPAPEPVPAKREFPPHIEAPSHSDPVPSGTVETTTSAQPDSKPEAALFAYISGESKEISDSAPVKPTRTKFFMVGALAVTSAVLIAVPGGRRSLQGFYRSSVHAGGRWLNPPPAPLPQAVAQHDSFGQSGDEYKLPVAANIPDATTDPSQIHVVAIVDPTAKPDKNAQPNGETQSIVVDTSPTDQNQAPNQAPDQSPPSQPPESKSQASDPSVSSGSNAAGAATPATPVSAPSEPPQLQNAPAVQFTQPQPKVTAPVRATSPTPTVSAGNNPAIPSSLKSQTASSAPEASGNKPVEAAMSSIEPVKLPESAIRELLSQPVDPEYPAAAKGSGQRGSVVLQVLIGRDGAVQDAKFQQGSLVFAKVAIDAVKEWRFKPYSMNGRAVSVQSVITLNFQPPS